MRILLYTMNGYPFEGSIQPIYAAVLGSLQRAGHTVTVLTATPHSTPDGAETWVGAEVVGAWTWSPAFLHRYPVLARALGEITFCLASLVAGLLLPRKFDLVLTAPHPPIAIGLNTRLIARAKRCPFVYCVEDIYPDVLVESGLMRRGLLFRLLRYLERGIYRKAARVSVLSESIKSNLMAKKIPADKIEIVPCFVDTDRIKPLPRDNPWARRFGLHNVFVLLYSGNLSFRYGVEDVLAAVERMEDQPDLQWVFMDLGRHCREYRREITDRNLDRVRILPFPSEEDYPRLLASCDIGLVTLERGFGAYSVLSRMLSFMAAARPILAMADSASEVSRIVRRADCGVVVEPGDISGFVAAARQFADDPERCRTLGLKARRYVETECPPDALLRRYDEILRACMESSR